MEAQIIGRKRSYWRGLLHAYVHGGKRGTRVFRRFRALAAQQQPCHADAFSRHRSDLLHPHELAQLRKARVLFLLPSASPGGGTNVVLTEARSMRSLGIDVWIANEEFNRAAFEPLLRADDPPRIYLRQFKDVLYLAREFDAVVATAWWTTESLRALAQVKQAPTLGYYVQDFEPNFYSRDDKQHQSARESYHLPSRCILFTKTLWNQQEVLREEAVHSIAIGPSYDASEFNTNKRIPRDAAVRICAMVRPETPRRAPEATMRVLKRLKERYNEQIHVAIFGCTPAALESASLDAQFQFEALGVLNSSQVAQLLRRTDIFLDLSKFQAMGLTAMEAMACGAAVIGPKHGGLGEIVEDEVSGMLIDTLDENLCIDAAAKLIDDPAILDRMGRAGAERVVRFTPDEVAARLARLLLLNETDATRDAYQR